MRIVIGCEESGTTRRAFEELGLGHEVWSVDILPSRDNSPRHHQGDVLEFVRRFGPFDLGIFHPPCTYLSSSGLFRNLKDPVRAAKTLEAMKFAQDIWALPIEKLCIENPVGRMTGALAMMASQYLQPFEHGHKESKRTGLWHRGLPNITPTQVMVADYCCEDGTRFPFELGKWGCPNCEGISPETYLARPAVQRWANQTFTGQNVLGPSKDRAMKRSKTYEGIARAWAQQWGTP